MGCAREEWARLATKGKSEKDARTLNAMWGGVGCGDKKRNCHSGLKKKKNVFIYRPCKGGERKALEKQGKGKKKKKGCEPGKSENKPSSPEERLPFSEKVSSWHGY